MCVSYVCHAQKQNVTCQVRHDSIPSRGKERGIGDEISEIANDLGLKRVLSCPSRFDILYQDMHSDTETK